MRLPPEATVEAGCKSPLPAVDLLIELLFLTPMIGPALLEPPDEPAEVITRLLLFPLPGIMCDVIGEMEDVEGMFLLIPGGIEPAGIMTN